MNLQRSAVSGVKWSSVSKVGTQVVQLVTIAVLARLLSPLDFGLMGMTLIIIDFIMLFSDMGTSAAVIQRKEISEGLLSSIFWINVSFGLLATVVLFMSSSLAASFFEESRITPIIRVVSLTFAISGLSLVQKALLERRLAFNILAKVEIIAVIAGALVAIGAALNGAGVWSFVYQLLVVSGVTTVLLWSLASWRPKRIFHWSEVKSVMTYSLNLTGFQIVNYFSRRADHILIGRFLGAQSLGYYALAYRIMLYPLRTISGIIGRVMFPVYSKVQESDIRFQRIYLKVAKTIALVSFPMMLGLMVLSEPFTLAVLGPNWRPVIPLLILLAPIGMLQSIGTTTGTIYQSKGRTDWMFKWGVAVGIIRITAIIIGLRWGIVGVAIAYAISSLLLLYPNYAIPFRLISMKVRSLFTALWRPLLCGLIMTAVLFAIRAVPSIQINFTLQLAIAIPIGGIVYFTAIWIFARALILDTWELAKNKD